MSPLRADTTYDGPATVSTLAIGGRSIRLVRPADPDRLLNDPGVLALNESDDYMPYWAYLWPGAYLLAEAVAREPISPQVTAIELGCGLGLAGLSAVAAGVRVRFTDYDETPLRFVEQSIAENGFDPALASTARLDWRELPDERYGLILGADVLYERRLVPLVVAAIDRLLDRDGVALVAGPYRVATEDLDDRLKGTGLVSESSPLSAITEDGAAVRGTLHRIRRRG